MRIEKIKLFANIHLDTELDGSQLLGEKYSVTSGALLQWAKDFQHEEKTTLPEDFMSSLAELGESPFNEDKVYQELKPLYNKPGPLLKDSLLAYFEKNVRYTTLAERINALSDGESLSIGGGYLGVAGKAGHCVLYRFKKLKKELIIEVFNTGCGAEYHTSALTQAPDWYQTQASYQLNKSEDLEKILQAMAIPLILPRLPCLSDSYEVREIFSYNMSTVYSGLIHYCKKIFHQDGDLVSKSYVGQQSGTCGIRVFTPLMNQLLPDKGMRNHFRLYYKYRSIEEFYKEAQQDGTVDDWKLLSVAVAKLMRVMRKKISKIEFGNDIKFDKILHTLSKIHQNANKIISSERCLILPNTEKNIKEEKAWEIQYSPAVFQKPTLIELKMLPSEDLSTRALEKWVDKNQKNKKLNVVIFYERLDQILAMKHYGHFEKRCAIESLVKFIHNIKVSIDTSQVNDRKKLYQFYTHTETVVVAFKNLGIREDRHNIPATLDTLRVTSILSTLIREACLNATKNTAIIKFWPTEGLWESVPNSAGFFEEKELTSEKFHDYPLIPKYEFQITLSQELLENRHFKNIYKAIAAQTKMNESNCLANLLNVDEKEMLSSFLPAHCIDKDDYINFKRFAEQESLAAICGRGGNILQQLSCLDEHIQHPNFKSIHASPSNHGAEFNFHFEKSTDENNLFQDSIRTLVNRSQIRTAKDLSTKMTPTEENLLQQLALIFSLCPEALTNDNPHKISDYFHTQAPLKKIMEKNEKEFLKTIINSKTQQNEAVTLALGFTESGLKFFNVLDYFSRNPSKLTSRYYQIVFFMGIFGGGGQDLAHLNEKHFLLLKTILEYNIKLFLKDQAPAHGIFLLEFLTQFKDTHFSHPWLNHKFETLLPAVLDACPKGQRLLRKQVLCAVLIQKIHDFHTKMRSWKTLNMDDMAKDLCHIVALNKEQQDLSSQRNYRTFAKSGSMYFNLISEYYPLLGRHPEYLIKCLYPQLSFEEQGKIAATLEVNDFPSISMTINESPVIFNIARGELSELAGTLELKAIPEEYITAAFGAEFDHEKFIKNIERYSGIRYQSVRSGGIENDVIIKAKEWTFHFQKDKKGRPVAFLEYNNLSYQKIDISNFNSKEVHSLFLGIDCSIWINTDSNSLLAVDQNLKVILSGNLAKKEIIKKLMHREGDEGTLLPKSLYCSADRQLEAHLQNFAGSDFNLYESLDSGVPALSIEMPSYQISFTSKEKLGGFNYVFSADQRLRLDHEKRLNFPGSLTLRDKENNYYLLFTDLPYIDSGKEGYFRKAAPDYNLISFEALHKESEPEFKQFNSQRKYYQIAADSKGRLQPQSLEEKLFLCSYYLSHRRYDDAFSLIQAIQNDEIAESGFAILELLHRIIYESPKLFRADDEAPFNETILAVKMRAMLLVTNIKIARKITWPPRLHDFITFSSLEKVKTFFAKFPDKNCQKLLVYYVRNISQAVYPEALRLKNEELRILLDADFAAKLNQNKQVFQWKGRQALTPQAPSAKNYREFKQIAESLDQTMKKVNQHAISLAKCEHQATEEKFAPHWVEEKHLTDISAARRKITAERKKKEKLLEMAPSFLNQGSTINVSLTYQIESLQQGEQAKIDLLKLCHELQQSNTDIQQAIQSCDLEELHFSDLVTAYLRNDPTELAQKLGVPRTDKIIPLLFMILENMMKQDVLLRRVKMAKDLYDKISTPPKPEDTLPFITALYELDSEYKLTEKNRELLIFEYYEHKRLRRDQIKSIEHVLTAGNENTCVQFIMGGGKTSVFLPLAAAKNADGDALSIVIMPEAQLATNEKKLDSMTVQLFASKPQSLHFDRDTPVEPKDLLQILNTLKKTQKQKGYLLTSRETLQALELKYIEILGKTGDDNHAKCIQLLEEILLLFRKKGKAIIDEVDWVLHIRKEFNYSNGDPVPLDKVFISDTLDLYRALDSVPQKKPTRDNVNEIMRLLLEQLKEQKGFVSTLVARFPNESITDYLLGQAKLGTDFFDNLSGTEKNRLALIKHQLTKLLPLTLLEEIYLDYGPSKLHPEKFSAIPYICNNVPAETSRFSSPYKTFNLTVQMHLASPPNHQLLENMLHHFRVEHFNESVSTGSIETKASEKFQQLTGLTLDTVYREYLKNGNPQYLENFLLKNDDKMHKVKYYLIENEISQEVTYFPEMLKSDSLSFVDQLHSSIGISGTMHNHHTWHSRMKLETDLNPDTDGRTLFHLLEKNGRCTSYPKEKIVREEMKSALADMLKNERTRAIIDLGALFTGITSEEVATALANAFAEKNSAIHYVLYYDNNNRLKALSVKDRTAIFLETTDTAYLNKTLGCDLENRFTFYDQSHTTGSDIQQMPDAHAIATIGEKTLQRDLVQGVMRMRGFPNQQTVECLVSKAAGPLKSLEEIIGFTRKNQNDELLDDHYCAACKKISALVRDCLMRILLTTLPRDKAKAFEAFKAKLMLGVNSPYEQYGQLITQENIKTALETRMKIELAACQQAFTAYPLPESAMLLQSLKEKMNAVVEQAIPICNSTVESAISPLTEQVEVQAQQQLQQQTEELQQISEIEIPLKSEELWGDHGPGRPGEEEKRIVRVSENGRCTSYYYPPPVHSLKSFHPAFGDNIFVTENYGYLENFSKLPEREIQAQRPQVYCLFSMDKNTGTLTCFLITQKEAARYRVMESRWAKPDQIFWLETLSGEITLSGNKPEEIGKDESYRRILEQAQYFHGDTDLLLKHQKPLWLGSLDPEEGNKLLNQILSNPFFKSKKQHYHAHQEEIYFLFGNAQLSQVVEIAEEKQVAEIAEEKQVVEEEQVENVLSLTSNYLNHLKTAQESQAQGSTAWQAIQRKIGVVERLKQDLTKNDLAAFRDKIAQPEIRKILIERRYISNSIQHATKVFLKGIALCISGLLDLITLGGAKCLKGSFITQSVYARFFKVEGKEYLTHINNRREATNNNQQDASVNATRKLTDLTPTSRTSH